MASNVQSNLGEDAIITEMRERCQSFVQVFKAGKEKFSTIQIWNKISIFAGSTAQRNNLFRLLLLSLANAEAQICLKSITGYRFIDGYLCKYSNGLQNLKLTEMHPSMIHEAYPIWFVRVAFVVLENMVYLLKCLSDITGPDGSLVCRPLSNAVQRSVLTLPTEEVLNFIEANYAEENEGKIVKVVEKRKVKRKRDAEMKSEEEQLAKRARPDNPPLAQPIHSGQQIPPPPAQQGQQIPPAPAQQGQQIPPPPAQPFQPAHLLPMGAGVNGQPGQMGYGVPKFEFTNSDMSGRLNTGHMIGPFGSAGSEIEFEHSHVMNQGGQLELPAQPIHQPQPAQPFQQAQPAQPIHQPQPFQQAQPIHQPQPAQPFQQAQPAQPIHQPQPFQQAQPIHQPQLNHFNKLNRLNKLNHFNKLICCRWGRV
eukprot:983608_1